MPQIFNRLAIVLFLLGSISFANAQAAATPVSGWTYLQDSLITYCTAGSSSCGFQAGNILPLTAGSVRMVFVATVNNDAISSVSGGGSTWVKCPNCHIYDSAFNNGQGRSIDVWYAIGGSAGAVTITVNLTSGASGFFAGDFVEIMPPSGSNASYDTSGAASNATCTTCTAVGLALSSGYTDAIVQMTSGPVSPAWNAFSGNYITDIQSNGVSLNTADGTAPTIKIASGRQGALEAAIAFKSTLGQFIPPAQPIAVVNQETIGPSTNGVSCNPNCTLTIPQTTPGNFLYIEAGGTSSIKSISGGGSWVIPTGGSTCQISYSGYTLSCAWVMSATSTTSLALTMNGNTIADFSVWELSGGPFTLDKQNSGTTTAGTLSQPGIAFTGLGANDVIFQGAIVGGGASSIALYPYPNGPNGLEFGGSANDNIQFAARLNTSDGTAPLWADEQGASAGIAVSAVAFTASGGSSSAPNPPSGLTVTVQ